MTFLWRRDHGDRLHTKKPRQRVTSSSKVRGRVNAIRTVVRGPR